MSSGNWIIDNIVNALNVWNEKLQEIWLLITQSPESFKGGGIWQIVLDINGALKAIGYALLVLFFVIGVVKTCGSFTEIKKPEHAAKLFIRFILAKAVVGYGLDIMMAIFKIVQGVISTAMNTAGLAAQTAVTMPAEMEAYLLAVDPRVGGIAHRKSRYYRAFVCNDNERLWQIFQIVPLHGYRPHPAVCIRRRAQREHRQKLFEKLCGGMLGGRNHRSWLHHL